MKCGLDTLKAQNRITGMQSVVAAASGQKPWESIVDELTSLEAPELQAAVEAADAAAAAAPDNNALRMAAAYAYAINRDYRYAMAAGRYPYAAGIHQALRGLYEGGKIDIDASV